ncbi:MAG: SAM-dependent methyltransferase, partial [Flavobacteriales bacterium]
MKKETINDIVQWDIHNWSKALPFWEQALPTEPLICLELGGRTGGLSLWLALKGHQVTCSDLRLPRETAEALHQKYKVDHLVTYETIDASKIPHENKFDVIVFKSMLGAVAMKGQNHKKQEAIDQMEKALKPGGILLFSENLEASQLHQWARKKFNKWGENWNYLKFNEVPELLGNFEKVETRTDGFLAAFGR